MYTALFDVFVTAIYSGDIKHPEQDSLWYFGNAHDEEVTTLANDLHDIGAAVELVYQSGMIIMKMSEHFIESTGVTI